MTVASMNRRTLLGGAAATAAALWSSMARTAASPEERLGLQLYTLDAELERDFAGTLRAVAALGLRYVEFARFFDRPAAQLRRELDAAGLRCDSAHFVFDELRDELTRTLDFAAELGLSYLVCAEASVRDRGRLHSIQRQVGEDAAYDAFIRSFTLSDWQWNAEFFNQVGERANRAGLKFAFHNHTAEFRRFGEVVAYDQLLRRTDASLVTMQLDCAWMTASGFDPVTYLERYPGRFRLLHVKDIVSVPATSEASDAKLTEVGAGIIQWPRIFAAARAAGVQHYFIEQDDGFKHSPLESVRASLEYVRGLDGPG